MSKRSTFFRFITWCLLGTLTLYTAESSTWAFEGKISPRQIASVQVPSDSVENPQVEALAKSLAEGPGFNSQSVKRAREVLDRLQKRVQGLEEKSQIAPVPVPAPDAPEFPVLSPVLSEIDRNYEILRDRILEAKDKDGQEVLVEKVVAGRKQLFANLDRYLQLLNQRQEYLSYYGTPQKVYERSWENLVAAQEKVEQFKVQVLKAEQALSSKSLGEDDVFAVFEETRAGKSEILAQHRHRVMMKQSATEMPVSKGKEESSEDKTFALSILSEPTIEDTTPNIDVRITDEMLDLAASLDNDALKIFNWVRNNIEYVPYYGGLKGSEQTLLDRAGNDMDTSSLLIALLRAANIPARFVIGSVIIDYERYRDWVGVETKDAVSAVVGTQAQPGSVLFLNQDGSPDSVRVGHTWVTAYLPANYRGTGGGQGDTWIQMDPTVKEVNRTAGASVSQYTQIDPNALGSQLMSAGVYDATTNQLTGFNSSITENYATELAGDVDTFYASQGVANDFFGQNDVLYGSSEINTRDYAVFPLSLPFEVNSVDGTYAELPNSLRYQVRFDFQKEADLSDPFSEEESVARTYASAELAAKRLTITYIPQSGADATTMYAVNQPSPTISLPDGSTAEISRMALVPADAVEVLPMLRIDGVPQMLGPIQTMGEENELQISFTGPQGTYSESAHFELQAGAYHAVGIDLAGTQAELSNRVVEQLIERLDLFDQTVALQEQGTGLTPDQEIPYDDLIGAALHVAALNFFVEHNFKAQQWAKVNNILLIRNPSVGVVSQGMKVKESSDFIGRITREILGSKTDLQVDIPLEMGTYISKNRKNRNLTADPLEGGTALLPGQVMNDQNQTREELLTGMAAGISGSQTEHRIMERQMKHSSLSAMKILNDAMKRGDPLTMLSKAQLATEAGRALTSAEISSMIRTKLAGLFGQVSASVETGIITEVNRGMIVFAPSNGTEVTAPDDPNFVHYEGSAYIYMDPKTGAGGYIIGSGADGSATLCGSETSDVAELVACAKSQLGSIAPACCCTNLGDLGSGSSIQDAIITDACAGCAGNVASAFIDISGLIGEAITCLVASVVGPALEVMASQMDDILASYPNGGRGVQPSAELKRMADTISVMMISLFGLFSNATGKLLDSLGISLPMTPGAGSIIGGYVALMMAHTFTITLLLEDPNF